MHVICIECPEDIRKCNLPPLTFMPPFYQELQESELSSRLFVERYLTHLALGRPHSGSEPFHLSSYGQLSVPPPATTMGGTTARLCPLVDRSGKKEKQRLIAGKKGDILTVTLRNEW
jgi:hypothetical protein